MSLNNISIDAIGLSVRAENALHRIGVHTVADMLQYDEEQLLQVRNLGQKSVREILNQIKKFSEMDPADWDSYVTETSSNEVKVPTLPREASEPEQLLEWLREKKIHIDVLELLSAKAYNMLMLNDLEFLYQIAFRTKEELLQIDRMDEACASEIVRWTDAWIDANKERILQELLAAVSQKPVTLNEMRFMPEHQANILEFVRRNDISVENMSISVRPKNQLRRNGYHMLSDIIFLTEEQIQSWPSMGTTSVEQILDLIRGYLKDHEDRILAFCNGDTSVLWDDTAIRKKILRLYHDAPFVGFSLKEMCEKMDFPADFSVERIKKVVGKLLAEKKLEYVDFRCYRLYERFEDFLSRCDAIDEKTVHILRMRLQGSTLEEIGREYGVTRERVRQIIKKRTVEVRNQYAMLSGDNWFDEDYYWYLYENYDFDRREASSWLGVPEAVWKYLDMMDVKQGKKDLLEALDDHENLEIGLRLKIKNYLNRNKIFVDGVWVDKRRGELEAVVAKKFCQEEVSFDGFVKYFNGFLEDEEIPYDENLYYTEAVMRTRKNRLSDSRFILWKQNEMLRYYDIDSRDYTELLETLNLDIYENVEYSTMKLVREYPQLMEKYDIRDQYELHNLLRKIIPEGSFHEFRCSRTPIIRFGTFDRESAMLDILVANAPISFHDMCRLVEQEYGYEFATIVQTLLPPLRSYYHEGMYTIDQVVMPSHRREALQKLLTEPFYYLDEIREIFRKNFADADPEEINPYNLKSMGFIVLSRYVIQHYTSLEAYCKELLTKEDVVDLKPYRQRLTYVQVFSVTLTELKRSLDVIEFEPGQLLNFRKLARAGITKEDLRAFCDAVYEFIPDGTYFCAQSLKEAGFESDLYDLGFTDWFYANLVLSDERFSYTHVFGNIILYKGKTDVTIQSFLVDRICAHGWIDTFDLMTELEDVFACRLNDKGDIIYRLNNTPIYHDKILDRLYANVDLYYRDLDEGGF